MNLKRTQLVFLALVLAAGSGLAVAQQAPEIAISFLNANPGQVSVEPLGGWPLSLSLVANETMLGLGTTIPTGTFYPSPEFAHGEIENQGYGYLVFNQDEDECPAWLNRYSLTTFRQHLESFYDPYVGLLPDFVLLTTCPINDTWLEITPGLSFPDPDHCGERPQVLLFDHESASNSLLTAIGPCVGTEHDGFGYGGNRRLPGLMVLSDTGVGVAVDTNFNRPSPAEHHNLAGLFHSVAYELKDGQTRTSILVHMNVPAELFSPVVLADVRVGDDPETTLIRVDGGPEQAKDWRAVLQPTVTVRAFVVNGRAPSYLSDHNGDGVVDIADASQEGLWLLSEQAIFRFQQLQSEHYRPHYFDFDGNDLAPPEQDVQPPGAGWLTPPPR